MSSHFEFQKWPVYQKAVSFSSEANALCFKLPKDGTKNLNDQLRRASSSISLNIAEGASRYSRNDKLQFLRVARGSVFECVAIIDLLAGMKLIEESALQSFNGTLAELGKMLSGFIKHVEKNNPSKTGSFKD